MKFARISSMAFVAAALLLDMAGNANALSFAPWTILFGFNSTHVDAAGRKVIDQIVSHLRSKHSNGYNLSVTGHADRTGPADYNRALSLSRAEAVRDLLIAAGIRADAITIAGRGETEPERVSEKENRRVVIIEQ